MSTLEIVGAASSLFISAVIVGHYIQEIFGDQGSPAQPTKAQIDQWAAKAASHNYAQRCLCEVDVFINVFTGGNLGETISSRTSRYIRSKAPEFILWKAIATWIIWLCDLVQSMHGVKAESGELARARIVVNKVRADLGLPPIDVLS